MEYEGGEGGRVEGERGRDKGDVRGANRSWCNDTEERGCHVCVRLEGRGGVALLMSDFSQ